TRAALRVSRHFTPSPVTAKSLSCGNVSSEQLSYLTCQFIGKKGLFEKSATLRQRLALLDCLFGVARHEEKLHIRAQGCDSLFELKAVDVRHHDIAHHKRNLVLVLPEDLDALRTV